MGRLRAGRGRLDREQLERCVSVRADSPGGPATIRVTSAEVIVLRKLDWYRRGGGESQRQWRDVLAVLRIQKGRLDTAFLERLASELELVDLPQRALEQSG